jgi:hypothetical protein
MAASRLDIRLWFAALTKRRIRWTISPFVGFLPGTRKLEGKAELRNYGMETGSGLATLGPREPTCQESRNRAVVEETSGFWVGRELAGVEGQDAQKETLGSRGIKVNHQDTRLGPQPLAIHASTTIVT